MSLGHGAGIVRSGSVFYVDAANKKSYSGSGLAWNNLSGNLYNRTLSAGITYSSSNKGVLTFNGTSDKISGLTASNLSNPTATTITFWFNAPPTSGRCDLSWICSDGIIISSNNNLLYLYDGAAYKSTSVVLFDNTWKQLTRVDNGSGNTLDFYINGVLVYTTQSNIVYGAAANHFFARYDGLASFFPGNASVIQIYNRALTSIEVRQNFNALRGRYGI